MDSTKERIIAVKAMEFLARQVNDEEVFELWLSEGVADGDIEYGDMNVTEEDEENLEYYIRDEEFADLMDTFLQLMKAAKRSGGLWCGGVTSK
ncbi:MAG: hypothetical protein KBT02_07370 [Treponema sp.]|nr:hypothetical protein [Candidatus Treponema caballi]